jgi:hypothetical protein
VKLVELKCGVHADRESATRPIFVCHHCGMPVCEEHGWVIATDGAFDASEEPVSRSAMHCPKCADQYHPRGANKRHGWGMIRPRPVVGQETPAPGQGPVHGPAAPRPPRPYPPQPPYPYQQAPYPPQPQQPYQQSYQPQPYSEQP